MDKLALVCEDVARVASKLKKIQRLADYLRPLDDAEFQLAVQFLSTGPAPQTAANHTLFETEHQSKLSVPRGAIRDALQRVCGWDSEIMRVCFSETGDSGETAALLLRGISVEEPMTLAQAEHLYRELGRARTTDRKRDLLITIYRRYKPLTIKYFIKVITRGLRIGLMGRMVEEAVAQSCAVPNDSVREANNRIGDLPKVAPCCTPWRTRCCGNAPVSPHGFHARQAARTSGRCS